MDPEPRMARGGGLCYAKTAMAWKNRGKLMSGRHKRWAPGSDDEH